MKSDLRKKHQCLINEERQITFQVFTFMVKQSNKIKIFSFIFTVFFMGCTPFEHKYGYRTEQNDLKQILVGTDTKKTVMQKWGAPSTQSIFPTDPKKGGSKWYYIYKKSETFAFYMPETKEQHVIVIEFDQKDIVQSVKRFEGSAEVPFNTNRTESTGYETGMLRDIFGNFGRYSGKKASDAK